MIEDKGLKLLTTGCSFGVFLAQEDNGKPWNGFAPNCVYTAEAAVVLTLLLVFEHAKKIPFPRIRLGRPVKRSPGMLDTWSFAKCHKSS